jgi:hypothetical protein
MNDVSPKVKSKVIKAIENGYSLTRGGDSGLLYKAICKEFDLPMTIFTKSNRKAWHYETTQHSETLRDMLIEVSKADCAAHMMYLSTQDQSVGWDKRTPSERFRDEIKSSKYGCSLRISDYYLLGTYMDIYQLRDMSHFKEILKYPTQQSMYNSNKQEALSLLQGSGSLVIEYKA